MMRLLPPLVAAALLTSTVAVTDIAVGNARAAEPPDVYMQAYFKRISGGELSLVYTALPKKHQADVREVVKEFADRMDGELYNGVFRSLNKACRVMKEKKEFFLNSAILKSQPPEKLAQQAKYWDPVVNALTRIARSQINSLEGLKETDPATFLVDVVDPAMKTAREITGETAPNIAATLKSFDEIKFAVVSNDGQTAVLKQIAPEEKDAQIKVVLVEDLWLPIEFVEEWDDKIAQAKTALGQMEITPEHKQWGLIVCSMVNQASDDMLKAQTQLEFDEAFQTIGGFLLQIGGAVPALQ